MTHEITIGGRKTAIEWTQESAKRFSYRMGNCGGEPTAKELQNPKTCATALFKALWALLPAAEFARHADPESLFVACDHETEAEEIYTAVAAIYADRFQTAEKKTTGRKSPSRK